MKILRAKLCTQNQKNQRENLFEKTKNDTAFFTGHLSIVFVTNRTRIAGKVQCNQLEGPKIDGMISCLWKMLLKENSVIFLNLQLWRSRRNKEILAQYPSTTWYRRTVSLQYAERPWKIYSVKKFWYFLQAQFLNLVAIAVPIFTTLVSYSTTQRDFVTVKLLVLEKSLCLCSFQSMIRL